MMKSLILNARLRNTVLVLFLVCLCACKEQIVHDVGEGEANRILTSLHQNGIEARKIRQPDGKWAVSVPRESNIKAISHLSQIRILREPTSSQSPGSSVVSSREDQRFRFERALSREIENTLLTIDGVFESRVHLNMPPADPLFGQRLGDSKGSASVLIISDQNIDSRPISEDQIRALVSGASGISPSEISVLLSQSYVSHNTAAQHEKIKYPADSAFESDTAITEPVANQAAGLFGLRIILSVIAFLLGSWLLFSALRQRRLNRLKVKLSE
jgi:type III secretion system YscJ/HrcJ family lipoprotein